MESLIIVFGTLLNEDGSPDIQARRQELRSLMSNLSSPELRFVKDYIDTITARTWIVDFVPKLPMEILMRISDYLTLVNLPTAQLVSKSWYKCFTQCDLVDHWARKHFKMAWETLFKNATPSNRLGLFNSLLRRTNRINRGNYHAMKSFSYDSSYDTESIRRVDGDWIAWTSNEMIFVRNLRNGAAEQFVTPDRDRVEGLCLRGDHILVARRSSTLYGWSITTKEMYTIRLTATPRFFDTKDGHAYIGVQDGSVFKWAIGGGVKQLAIPDLPKQKHANFTFLGCDPVSKDTLLRCYVQWISSAQPTSTSTLEPSQPARIILRFTAEKFDDYCLLSKSTIDIPLTTPGKAKLREGTLGMLASNDPTFDEDGNYNVTISSHYTLCEDCIDPQSSSDSCDCIYLFLRLRYNSIEGQWQQYRYATSSPKSVTDFAGPIHACRGMFFTHDRVLLPAIPIHQIPLTVPPRGSDTSFIVAMGADKAQGEEMRLPCFGGPDGKSITHQGLFLAPFSHWLKQKNSSYYRNVGLQYSWSKEVESKRLDPRNRFDTDIPANISAEGAPRFQIYGNSTFTVLFGPTGYIVFCHDRDVTLPKQSEDDLRVSREWSINPLTQVD